MHNTQEQAGDTLFCDGGKPIVSFVVPCYRLAHLLPECITSILSQSYAQFEVLIMDDQSPDHTKQVASSFADQRIRYVRNEHNLGHLRNYNKGIELARGKYVWLISADDFLRSPYILQRYVDVLERNPNIGYAFCSGVSVQDGRETGILAYSVYSQRDRIVRGRKLLHDLLEKNFVLAASALARRECYERNNYFPLDPGMEWSGDWLLWCLFALDYDVAYFAEPMVAYRVHAFSMTTNLATPEHVEKCSEGDLAIPLMIRQKAISRGLRTIEKRCRQRIVEEYVQQCTAKRYQGIVWRLTQEQFGMSLERNFLCEKERIWVRAGVFAGLGDRAWIRGDCDAARAYYRNALELKPWMMRERVKSLLTMAGVDASRMRRTLRAMRRLGTAQHKSEQGGEAIV